MALSADLVPLTRTREVGLYDLATTTTIYAGALVGLQMSSGLLTNWADTSGLLFKGLAMRQAVTPQSANPNIMISGEVNESGSVMMKVAVTGAGSAANVGDLVYGTDSNTLTLTPTANVGPIGEIERWYVSTTCDVKLFTPPEFRAWAGV